MPVVWVKCSSVRCLPLSTSMYSGQFAKLTLWCSVCLLHHAAVPTPPAGADVPAGAAVPFTPQAARNAAAAPAPVVVSSCRRESRGWVRPRHRDGSVVGSGPWPSCSFICSSLRTTGSADRVRVFGLPGKPDIVPAGGHAGSGRRVLLEDDHVRAGRRGNGEVGRGAEVDHLCDGPAQGAALPGRLRGGQVDLLG